MSTIEQVLAERQNGRLDIAEKQCRAFVAAQPENAAALTLLGALLLETGRAAEAEEMLQKSLAIDADAPDTLNNLGLALGTLGRLDEAQHFFARAITKRPNFVDAYYNLGLALQNSGKPDEAMAVYRKTIALKPNHAEALNNFAMIHHGEDRLAEAIALYRLAIAANPANEASRANLANALLVHGDRPGAMEMFRESLARNPHDPLANYALAQIDVLSHRIPDSTQKLASALAGLRARSDWLRHGSPQASRIVAYDIARYREAFEAAVAATKAAGIEVCLLCGTLLGAMREKNFILFDKDIDFGIEAAVTPAMLDAALSRDPRFTRTMSLDEGQVLPSYRFDDYAAVDFFRIFPEGDTLWYGLDWYGHRIRWRHRRFAFRDFEFFGVATKIPDDPDLYLTEAYGDWRTPNPYFAAWSSPNMDEGFPAVARCIAYGNIFKAAWRGDRKRADSLCEQYLALDPGDVLIAEIRQKILDAPIGASAPQSAVLRAPDDPFDNLA